MIMRIMRNRMRMIRNREQETDRKKERWLGLEQLVVDNISCDL
jgi:hypothetical protein